MSKFVEYGTFTISERPPETVADTLAPLAQDSAGFEFGSIEQVFFNQLKQNSKEVQYYVI
jgi:hypothetical protein